MYVCMCFCTGIRTTLVNYINQYYSTQYNYKKSHHCPQYVTEFWEMDPNHTFIFDYISHYHMNSIMFSKIFPNFVWILKPKLFKTSKKYSRNTSVLNKIPSYTPRNTLNYMWDLDPLSKIWSHISSLHFVCVVIMLHIMLHILFTSNYALE